MKRETEEIEQVKKLEEVEANDFQIVEGELLEVSTGEELTEISAKPKKQKPKSKPKNQKSHLQYIFLPFIFLTVSLLGGMRLNAADNAFLFNRPALVCLIFAAILLVLFFRAGLLRLDGWFSEDFSTLKNVANGAVLVTLFFASTQIFNSLIPEQGLPFWILAFCFFWTLWNNLFAEFDTKKLLKSLGAMFGLAFAVKYLILANFIASGSDGWLGSLTKDAFVWLLDLPRYSAGTGYIQFFAIVFYLLGLFLLPPVSTVERES